jgi:lysophospholipase L1-like esterase
MAVLPIDESISRFKENENRLDGFVNGDGYTTTGGQVVESVPDFIARKESEISATNAIAVTTANKNDALAYRNAAQSAASDALGYRNQAETFKNQAEAVAVGASSAIVGKATRAELNAALAYAAGTIGYVTNDPTPANNGYYLKSGASGSGSWAQSSYDRVSLVEAKANANALFNNVLHVFFLDKIKINRATNEVTYPNGYAIRNGVGFLGFNGGTFAMVPGVTNYHYFDYGDTVTPIKVRTNNNSPVIPVPDANFVTLGITYNNLFTSDFEYEYENSSRVYAKLANDMFNGNFANNAAGVSFYGDNRPTTTDAAPLVATNNATLNSLGCMYALKFEPGSVFTGNFAEVDCAPRGYSPGKTVIVSCLVHCADGNWNFGTSEVVTVGPYVYLVHGTEGSPAETNAQASSIVAYENLGGNVRKYTLAFTIQAVPAGKYVKWLRIGMRVGSNVATTFLFTGVWASLSGHSFRPNYGLTLDDTHWPNWSESRGSAVYRTREALVALDKRVTALETPSRKGLKALADALLNPLHSVQIRLIGDSITWGSGATGNSTSSPRSHQLTDVRNNLTAKTWANLLRDYLGRTYCDESTLIEENPLVTGSGYYQKVHTLDPTNKDYRFRFVHPVTQKELPTSLLTYQTRTGPFFGRCINMSINANYNAWFEFDLVGDNFKIVYAGQSSGTNRYADVYVDGALVGSWEYGAAVLWQQESPEFTVPFGKHKVQVRNRSTDGGNFRLEGVRVTRKIRVVNDGIIGTWTGEWLPGSPLLTGSVQDSDEFVFIQLGTNDRAQTSVPNDPIRTRDNLKLIATHVRDTLGKEVILMACNAVTSEDPATYKYNQGDVARVIYDLSQEMSLDFIDNYRATVQAKIDGVSYLADGLHPNDAGYRIMFENIRDTIERNRKDN